MLTLSAAHRAAHCEIHRAARADYLWMPGAPLVIDGHRLLARLWHVKTHWLGEAASGSRAVDRATRRGRYNSSRRPLHGRSNGSKLVLMPLLTERASMDSFQLSYADLDREEWPGLKDAPHVTGLLQQSSGCAPPFAGPAR